MNNRDSNQKAKVSCILNGCLISKYTGTESDVRTVVIYLSCKNTDLEKNEAKPKCFGTYLKASTRQTLIKQNLKSQSYFKGTGKEQAWRLIFSRWSQKKRFPFRSCTQQQPPASRRYCLATRGGGRRARRNRILARLHPVHKTPNQATTVISLQCLESNPKQKRRGLNDQIVGPLAAEREIFSASGAV